MKKIITVVCAVVLAFGFTGCKKDDNGIYIDDGSRTISDDCTVVDGEYIVRHKKSDYVIVTENAPDEYIDTAAQDFNLFFSAEHPKWYSTGGDQLCFTARGDENEFDEMIETLSDKFAAELMKEENRNKKYVRFSMMDNKNWCACEACNAAAEKYNAVSGALLTACNRMGKRTTEKLAAEGDDRTIKIVTLLYNKTEDVPVATTDGGYEKNENIGALDYVTPQWACMTMKNHAKAWAAEENNAARDMLERMNAVFEEFWVWDYGTNFNDYLLPFDTFNSMAEDMKLLGNYNIGLYLYQLANSAHNVSGFNSLKLYLLSKLMVDPSLDIDELTDDYFAHAYGKGGNAMRKIYDEYRLVALYNSEDHGDFTAWNQSIYSQTMLSADYWKRGTVKRWLALLDEALEESGNDGTLNAGTLKANSDGEYERNIMVDGVFVRYIYAVLYLQDEYADNIAFKLKLYNDVGALGFNHVKEQSDATANLWPLREALGIGNYL